MWDTTGGNELNDSLFDAALIIDPDARIAKGYFA
jgi:hypothetical protein